MFDKSIKNEKSNIVRKISMTCLPNTTLKHVLRTKKNIFFFDKNEYAKRHLMENGLSPITWDGLPNLKVQTHKQSPSTKTRIRRSNEIFGLNLMKNMKIKPKNMN
jgi:hypothetical protein